MSLLWEDLVCEAGIRLDSRLESDLECWRGDAGAGAAWVCDDWRKELININPFFVCAEKFTHPQNVVMGIVSTESNCSVGACAWGITIIAVTAVIRAIILGFTVNCLLMLLISKSALTASLPMSSRAQCWVIQSRKQDLIKARNFNQDQFLSMFH